MLGKLITSLPRRRAARSKVLALEVLVHCDVLSVNVFILRSGCVKLGGGTHMTPSDSTKKSVEKWDK